ncbi:hypothetical protein CAOG_03360 [Capsaspora owczarzaki ATCC 30864]|nr:hypothetical protein CAOG_03360 [Capsaspora owczarzaki ATCC 30864]|eukprot:XP_004364199.2 hypothetical protein CAOG_03360 [Capsaspora owczarzaki ATCC 30864]
MPLSSPHTTTGVLLPPAPAPVKSLDHNVENTRMVSNVYAEELRRAGIAIEELLNMDQPGGIAMNVLPTQEAFMRNAALRASVKSTSSNGSNGSGDSNATTATASSFRPRLESNSSNMSYAIAINANNSSSSSSSNTNNNGTNASNPKRLGRSTSSNITNNGDSHAPSVSFAGLKRSTSLDSTNESPTHSYNGNHNHIRASILESLANDVHINEDFESAFDEDNSVHDPKLTQLYFDTFSYPYAYLSPEDRRKTSFFSSIDDVANMLDDEDAVPVLDSHNNHTPIRATVAVGSAARSSSMSLPRPSSEAIDALLAAVHAIRVNQIETLERLLDSRLVNVNATYRRRVARNSSISVQMGDEESRSEAAKQAAAAAIAEAERRRKRGTTLLNPTSMPASPLEANPEPVKARSSTVIPFGAQPTIFTTSTGGSTPDSGSPARTPRTSAVLMGAPAGLNASRTSLNSIGSTISAESTSTLEGARSNRHSFHDSQAVLSHSNAAAELGATPRGGSKTSVVRGHKRNKSTSSIISTPAGMGSSSLTSSRSPSRQASPAPEQQQQQQQHQHVFQQRSLAEQTAAAAAASVMAPAAGVSETAHVTVESSLLHIAIACGVLDIAAALIARGALVDTQDSQGWAPLHYAAHRGNMLAVRLLLKHGALVSLVDFDGRTPLHIAAISLDRLECCIALVEYGAQIHAADSWAARPIDVFNELSELQMRLIQSAATAMVSTEAPVAAQGLRALRTLSINPETHRPMLSRFLLDFRVLMQHASQPELALDVAVIAYRLFSVEDNRGELVDMGFLRIVQGLVGGPVKVRTLAIAILRMLLQSGDLERDYPSMISHTDCVPLCQILLDADTSVQQLDAIKACENPGSSAVPRTKSFSRESVVVLLADIPDDTTKYSMNARLDAARLLLAITLYDRAQMRFAESGIATQLVRAIGRDIASIEALAQYYNTRQQQQKQTQETPTKTRSSSLLLGSPSSKPNATPPTPPAVVMIEQLSRVCAMTMRAFANVTENMLAQSTMGANSTQVILGPTSPHSGVTNLINLQREFLVHLSSARGRVATGGSSTQTTTRTSLPASTCMLLDWCRMETTRSLVHLGYLDVGDNYMYGPSYVSDELEVLMSSTTSVGTITQKEAAAVAAALALAAASGSAPPPVLSTPASDNIPQLRGASMRKLIEILTGDVDDQAALMATFTSHTAPIPPGEAFLDFFLSTYRNFVHPIVLLRLLIHRFRDPDQCHGMVFHVGPDHHPLQFSDRDADLAPVPDVHNRVGHVLCTWLSNYRQDFVMCPQLLDGVRGMIIPLLSAGPMYKPLASQLQCQLEDEPMLGTRSKTISSGARPMFCNHNFLYVQSREAILNETLPCGEEDCSVLSALHMHIESLHRRPSVVGRVIEKPSADSMCSPDLVKECVPPCFQKSKTLGKKIRTQLDRFSELSDRDAKHFYVQSCQLLASYRCKLFLVKDASGGKLSRSQPRIFGVNIDHIVLMDVKTKDMIQRIELQHLTSWEGTAGGDSVVVEHHDGTLRLQTSSANETWDLCAHIRKCVDQRQLQAKHGAPPTELLLAKCSCPPEPKLGDRFRLDMFTASDLLGVPLELARQLTLIEHSLFATITSADTLRRFNSRRAAMAVAQRVTDATRSVERFIERFNQVTMWVTSEVLNAGETVEQRVTVIVQLIKTAQNCRELNNFSGVMEIVAGLSASPVRRLRKTWKAVPQNAMNIFRELEDLMSTKSNYKTYRAVIKEASTPAVPYFGIYLKDLTFIDDGNPDLLRGGLINVAKRRQVYSILKEIEFFQEQPYNLQDVPDIRQFLGKVRSMTEDEMHALSRKLEPSAAPTSAAGTVSGALAEALGSAAIAGVASVAPPTSLPSN